MNTPKQYSEKQKIARATKIQVEAYRAGVEMATKRMNEDTPKEKWAKRFSKYFQRIEETMTGHISGRRIWSVGDDEDSYAFVDDSLKSFIAEELKIARRELLDRVEKEVIGVSMQLGAGTLRNKQREKLATLKGKEEGK
jgi:hypothetical protein